MRVHALGWTETHQTHLIGKNAILGLVPVVAQPVHAVDLEWHELELSVLTKVRLVINSEFLFQ